MYPERVIPWADRFVVIEVVYSLGVERRFRSQCDLDLFQTNVLDVSTRFTCSGHMFETHLVSYIHTALEENHRQTCELIQSGYALFS